MKINIRLIQILFKKCKYFKSIQLRSRNLILTGLLTKCLEFGRRRLVSAVKSLIVSCQHRLWLSKWESIERMSSKKQKLMIVQLLQFLSYSRKAVSEYIFVSYTQAKIDLLNMSRYQPPLPHSLKFCSKKDMKIKIFCFRFTCLCIITGVFLNNKVQENTYKETFWYPFV